MAHKDPREILALKVQPDHKVLLVPKVQLVQLVLKEQPDLRVRLAHKDPKEILVQQAQLELQVL